MPDINTVSEIAFCCKVPLRYGVHGLRCDRSVCIVLYCLLKQVTYETVGQKLWAW